MININEHIRHELYDGLYIKLYGTLLNNCLIYSSSFRDAQIGKIFFVGSITRQLARDIKAECEKEF